MNGEASQQRYQPSLIDLAGEMAEAAVRLNCTRLARLYNLQQFSIHWPLVITTCGNNLQA